MCISAISIAGVSTVLHDMALVANLESRVVPAHQLQAEYLALVQLGRGKSAFEKAFIHGDRLFDSAFNALDGGAPMLVRGSATLVFRALI